MEKAGWEFRLQQVCQAQDSAPVALEVGGPTTEAEKERMKHRPGNISSITSLQVKGRVPQVGESTQGKASTENGEGDFFRQEVCQAQVSAPVSSAVGAQTMEAEQDRGPDRERDIWQYFVCKEFPVPECTNSQPPGVTEERQRQQQKGRDTIENQNTSHKKPNIYADMVFFGETYREQARVR